MDTKLNLATKLKCHDVVIDVSPQEGNPELGPGWRVGDTAFAPDPEILKQF